MAKTACPLNKLIDAPDGRGIVSNRDSERKKFRRDLSDVIPDTLPQDFN
jgi:hypothetical protein